MKGDQFTIEATITGVYQNTREHANQYGVTHYVKGVFADGSEFDIGVKEQNIQITQDRLRRLQGLPCLFTIEDRGTYEDIQQYSLKDYPGKHGSELPMPTGSPTQTVPVPQQAVRQQPQQAVLAPQVAPSASQATPPVVRGGDGFTTAEKLLAMNVVAGMQVNGLDLGQIQMAAEHVLSMAQDQWSSGNPPGATEGEGGVGQGAPSGVAPGEDPAPLPPGPTPEDWGDAYTVFGTDAKAPILAAYRARYGKATTEITSEELRELVEAVKE